jgi:uncharacterized protein (TIGR02246 family)
MGGQDEAAVRAVVAQFAEAWNRHDMHALAGLFADDADCVNAGGTWWRGRAAIEAAMRPLHAAVFKASRLTSTDVRLRFLKPDVAVAHATWELTGMLGRDSQTLPPRRGIIILVLAHDGATWPIVAFQNTDIVAPPEYILR